MSLFDDKIPENLLTMVKEKVWYEPFGKLNDSKRECQYPKCTAIGIIHGAIVQFVGVSLVPTGSVFKPILTCEKHAYKLANDTNISNGHEPFEIPNQ